MTRNALFTISSPRRSVSGLAALPIAAVLCIPFGLLIAREVSAQPSEEASNIQQVAGESGGLLSGLFGGSSDRQNGKPKEPYRHATPVPSDREVDWSGIPYHSPSGGRTASSQPVPIRDPGATRRSAAQPNRSPLPNAVAAPSGRSSIPTPPPVARTSPRRISDSEGSLATSSELSSRRAEPLSSTQSSRRPVNVESLGSEAKGMTAKPPTLAEKSEPRSIRSEEKSAELIPRVSRRVLAASPPATKTTKQPAAVDQKPAAAPTQDTVVKSGETSSRRSQTTPETMPKKIGTSPKEPSSVASHEIESQSPLKRQAPASTAVASAPAPRIASAQPEAKASVAGESSERKQANQDNNAPASLGVPSASPQQLATDLDGMDLPSDLEFAKVPSSGSLAATRTPGMDLNSVNDHQAADGQNEPAEATTPQSDLQASSQEDAFAPRAVSGSAKTLLQHANADQGKDSDAAQDLEVGAEPAKSAISNSASDDAFTAVTKPVAMEANSNANSNMTTTELPIIRIMTAGPRQVTIRQTHPYEIRVENRGSVDAQDLIVRAYIPDWADVVGQQVSRGDVQGTTEEQVRKLNWRIDRLAAGQTETMLVRLKASRSGTHDLDVDYTIAPQKRVVQITVQEPQLALTIDGPEEVVYGQSQTYQIRVLNSGDGVAPSVVFTLSPESSAPQSQRIGDIPAGKEAQFEVELTAQDLGELKIHGVAVGDFELKADADKTVRVLAANLEAVLIGPQAKYQSEMARYQLELANHGTTASENVVATLELPAGVTYQGGMEDATMIDNQLRWKVASLAPGAVRKYQFECQMDTTGTQQFEFACKGSAAGKAKVTLDTNVEAIADLKLSVVDPPAPAPVGEDVNYEIIIRNRGSKSAHDVRAVAQFSHGIEPKQIIGHAGKVITGQVLIDPIASIEAGQEVRVTIVARAEIEGNHRFRTEVRSGDTVLVAEEANYFIAPKNDRVTRRSGSTEEELSVPLR